MTNKEKALLYGTVVGLGLLGVLLLIACIICKFCISSKKAQRWSGLDKFLGNDTKPKAKDDDTYKEKNSCSNESDLMLKMQQGEYVGYDTLERDISIPKLPDIRERTREHNGYQSSSRIPCDVFTSPGKEKTTSISLEFISNCDEQKAACANSRSLDEKLSDSCRESIDTSVDMTDLKSAVQAAVKPQVVPKVPNRYMYNGTTAHSFHNSYTIYEESSDLSGSESMVQSQTRVSDLSDTESHSTDEGSQSDATSESSYTQQFGSSQDLLDHHLDDSGLGQVEYSLQYYRDPGQLVLHIIQAHNLDIPVSATGELPDAYIKAFASHSDDLDPKKQTKICKSTANPIFKENFIFRMTPADFHIVSITLQVFTRDHYARQKLVGEILIKLSPLCSIDSYRTWSNILDYDHQPLGTCGEVRVALKYSQESEELSVVLSELKSLKLQNSPVYQTKDIYLAVTIFTESNLPQMKKRTANHSIYRSSNSRSISGKPLQFKGINHLAIHDSKLLIEMCEEFPDKSHETLGYTILGAGTTDTEYAHWLLIDSMAANSNHPQEPVSMWHDIHIKPPRSKYRWPHRSSR